MVIEIIKALGNDREPLIDIILFTAVVFYLGCTADAVDPATDSGGSGDSVERGSSIASTGMDTVTATSKATDNVTDPDNENNGNANFEIDTSTDDDDLFSVAYDISPKIATVGIVKWSISEPITAARIVLGPLDGDFELTGAVDLE